MQPKTNQTLIWASDLITKLILIGWLVLVTVQLNNQQASIRLLSDLVTDIAEDIMTQEIQRECRTPLVLAAHN